MNGVSMEAAPQQVPAPQPTYLSAQRTIRSWLFTSDHKRIALLYICQELTCFA